MLHHKSYRLFKLRKIFSSLLILVFLAACSQVFSIDKTPVLPTPTTLIETVPTQTEASGLPETPSMLTATEMVTPSAEAVPEGGTVLNVWVPPQFDPNAGTPAGEMFKARLLAFEDEHPGTQIKVRVKALDGPGGLLDSLVTASAAAPGALPDLVALSRPLLEKAALRGLVYSYDGLSTVLNQEDWYGYARDLAYLQQSTFGLPFAGDALVLVYQPQEEIEPPRTWNRVLEYPGALAFAASDPAALFTLAQYQSAGGKIQDEQGRPTLDAAILSEVLNIYTNALQAGRVSDRLAQFSTQEQVWNAFQEEQYTMAVTWASLPLIGKDTDAILIPTPDGISYTLATGWAWAIASPQSQNRDLSAALAEYLVESDFLAQWSEAGGFLPPRAGALELWGEELPRSLVSDLSTSAQLIPPGDIISSLGPALQQSVLQVLRQEKTPTEAAQEAVNSLGAR
jgi:multiple sugar transport system substrate-binding protein